MTSHAPHTTPAASPRRARYGVNSLVLVLAASIACVVASFLASRLSVRWDLTGSREHTLAPRTVRLLAALDRPHRVVVSGDLSSIDRPSRQRVGDLLAEMSRSSPMLTSTWIDTGAPDGRRAFAELLAQLAQQHAPAIDAQREALASVARDTTELARELETLSAELDRSAPALLADDAGQTELRTQAGLLRTIGARLEGAARIVAQAAAQSVAGVAIPAPDTAQDQASRPLTDAAKACQAIGDFARQVSAARPAPAADEAARRLAQSAQPLGEQAAFLADHLAQLRPLEPLSIARVLESTDALLVLSPTDAVAIELASLFPAGPGAAPGASPTSSEVVFTGEQLIGTALGALEDQAAPIVCFVHAENTRLLDDRGAPSPVARRALGRLLDRLRLNRAEPAEWALASAPARPDFAALDPRRRRPVVWLVLGAPSSAGVDPRQPQAVLDRASRVDRLGAAIATLFDAGENVLLCIDPSDRPGVGEADPIVARLPDWGLQSDSGRVVIARQSSPTGPLTSLTQVARAHSGGHPVADAARGLATALAWPSALTLIDPVPSGVHATALLTVAAGDETWGESQWLGLRELIARGRARPLEPVRLADPPVFNPGRDTPGDARASWILAAASERDRAPERPRPAGPHSALAQRLIVVASPSWIDDAALRAVEDVQGRSALRFPGNSELFDASLAWLSGRDELIAPGPQSQDVPRVGPIAPGTLTLLRWLLIAGLPALVLALGGLLRVTRG